MVGSILECITSGRSILNAAHRNRSSTSGTNNCTTFAKWAAQTTVGTVNAPMPGYGGKILKKCRIKIAN
jgi:hypothetical protein